MLGDDELSFRGDISVVIKPSPMAPVQLVLSFDAALKGCIKNTFGFKGFDICDVAMGLSIDALRCGAGLVGCFEGIRIQGMFKFGSRKAILAVKIEARFLFATQRYPCDGTEASMFFIPAALCTAEQCHSWVH